MTIQTPIDTIEADPAPRNRTVSVDVGGVRVGGDAPVVVQSMTNTDTADVDATVAQVAALAKAGSEIVRITVDRDESAAAVPKVKERLDRLGVTVPLVGDFHYIGHKLLADHPACAEALAKYRINPGNVGFRDKRDKQFSAIVEMAIRYDKPVRIGVNWGSLDQELLTRLMDENNDLPQPRSARAVTREAIIQSALLSAQLAEEIGLARDRIILSAKVSQVQDLIAVYRDLSRRTDHRLHLGLTEAGMGSKGIVASSAAMGILLQEGIGDTIRVSLTPEPGGDRTQGGAGRAGTSADHGLPPVRAGRRRLPRLRAHDLDGVPGAGREDPERHPRQHAGLARALSRRRGAERRGDGLHRQRAGRIQARRHRHLAARHRRDAGRPGLRRRQEDGDAARAEHRGRIPGNGRGLYRAAFRIRPRCRGMTRGGGWPNCPSARRAALSLFAGVLCVLAPSAFAQAVGPEPADGQAMVLPALPFPPSPPALEGETGEPAAGTDKDPEKGSGESAEAAAGPAAAPADTPPAPPTARDICALIGKDAEAVGMPKDFFARLIWKESRFDIKAVSPVGAQGIAQFMPYTAAERGLDDPYDLKSSIRHSAQYLADLRTELGNWGLAAAAYNGGINRVKSWIANGGYLPAETENYVAAITFRPADWFKEDGHEVEHHPLDDDLEFLDGCAQLPIMKTRSVFGSLAAVDSAPMKPWGVQVAGNERQAVAMRMYARVKASFPSILGDIKPIVMRTRTSPMRRIYAVRVGADSKSEADALCNRLRGAGGFCIVMKN